MSKAAELAALIGSQTALSDRSVIINGAMQVAQRATSSTSTGYCSLDRFRIHPLNTDELAYTWAQDDTVPAGEGFSKSAKLSITTAENSVADNEIFRILHRIEGQNMQRASWGTSSAKPLTLSFFVRSNVTGTYAVEFRMNAGGNNSLSKNYTINSADTWERKTITFPKNTSTNFSNDNTEGCELGWYLAAGANYTSGSLASDYGANATNTRAAGQTANITSSSSNTWYITGVQLEIGEQATPFEHRSFGDELLRCQRYYYRVGDDNNGGGYHRYGVGSCQGTSSCGTVLHAPVKMRTTPTLEQTGTASNYALYEADSVHACTSVPAINSAHCSPSNFNITFTSSGNLASGNAAEAINNNNTTSFLAFAAEL